MWLQLIYYGLIPLMAAVPSLGLLFLRISTKKAEKFAIETLDGSRDHAELPKGKQLSLATPEDGHRFKSAFEALERRAQENSDHNIYGYIHGLIEELRELESKLRIGGIDQQARLTYAKYEPMVEKIVELTSPKYYGDFVRNPDHWNDPKQMRLQVEFSVLAVAKEAAEDIRRLNSSQELNFQVSVESLVGKGTESSEPKDSSKALQDLLGTDREIDREIKGTLEGLTQAVTQEAKALLEAEAKRRAQDELKAEKIRAGSKLNLEESTRPARMKKLTGKVIFQQQYAIYSSGVDGEGFQVEYRNFITGENSWKKFPSAYEAADWVDSAVAELEKKHDFKCGCVYCREGR